jgi:trehalose 6-phosphate phosphatase
MSKLKNLNYEAVILDMDGVITKTAIVHAKAWKNMFDEFLKEKHGESFQPLDIKDDYNKYIDGIPRHDGIRSFLKARNIDIPEGDPDDDPEEKTVQGLGKKKNKIFREIIEKEGVEVYDDALEMIDRWKKENIKLAVISSSKNCKYILEKSGLEDRFDVRVDGITLIEENLKGKPEPDMFVKAAEYLGVNVEETIIIEDAIQGVQAGQKGRFAFVVGVARNGKEEALKKAGADIVVKKLTELYEMDREPHENLPNALIEIEQLFKIRGDRKFVVCLDYDGTLTPIVSDPEAAELPDDNRDIITQLSNHIPVAVISGRDLQDLKRKIEINSIIYAGSHGFDISGPDGLEMVHESEKEITPALDKAEQRLNEHLKDIRGAKIERKKFAIAVHYRNVDDHEVVQSVKNEVQKEADRQEILKTGSGKKIMELKPDIDWNKGYALTWLTEKMGWNAKNYLRIYIGDDITDEDGFEAIKESGIGILVGSHGEKTSASFALKDTEEVTEFVKKLKERI